MRNEIVVGLDDSLSSTLALQWAARHAKTTDAVLGAVTSKRLGLTLRLGSPDGSKITLR